MHYNVKFNCLVKKRMQLRVLWFCYFCQICLHWNMLVVEFIKSLWWINNKFLDEEHWQQEEVCLAGKAGTQKNNL